MNIPLLFAKISLSVTGLRADFYEDMAAALRDGTDIVTYLKKRLERASKSKDPLGPIYELWLDRMDNASFANALKGTVPPAESMVIMAAERGAALHENLEFLARTIRDTAAMKWVMLGAIAMPIFVLIVTVLLIYGFSVKFVPVLVSIIPADKWPASGMALKFVADLVLNYGVVLLALLVAIAAVIIWSMNGLLAPIRRTLDQYPPWSLFRAYSGAMTLISLASLIRAGTSLTESLSIASSNAGAWSRYHLAMIQRRLDIMSGQPGAAFDTGMLSNRVLYRIVDRSERTGFGEALQFVGMNIIAHIKREVSVGAKILNSFMMLMAGAAVIFMVIGFLETMYSIQAAMRQ